MRHGVRVGIGLLLALSPCFRTSPVRAGEVRVPIGMFCGGSALTLEVKSIKELRDEGVVRQQLDFSCGAAAVATILTSYLDMPCTENEIITALMQKDDPNTLLARKGFSLLDLKKYAESRGIQAVGYKLTLELMRGQYKPILVPLFIKEQNRRHFVVFLGMQDDQVFLADPATGRHSLPVATFETQWDTKIGMIFSKPGSPQIQRTALAIRSADGAGISSGSVLAIALPATIAYVHVPFEF